MRALGALLAVAGVIFGHTTDQAAVLLDFRGDHVEVELQLPLARVQAALDADFTEQETTKQLIAEYVRLRIQATSGDGRKFSNQDPEVKGLAGVEGSPYVIVQLTMIPPAGVTSERFDLRCDVLLDRIRSQVALVSIRSDWRGGTFANAPMLIGTLGTNSRVIAIDRRDGSWSRGFGTVFVSGTEHIAEGTDHLLFLLVLLLPAPLKVTAGRWKGHLQVRSCLWNIAKVVTAFTLGHSLTLALGTLDWLQVPSEPVEAAIALSILISAFHAVRPLFPGREAWIACGFGLIHGLAFATTLGELGLARYHRLWAIVAFNLGIEAMQLIVVGAAMPSLLLLSRTPWYAWVRVPGALFAAIAALGWTAERVTGVVNPLEDTVSAVAHRAWLIALLLTATSLLATRLLRGRELPASTKFRRDPE